MSKHFMLGLKRNPTKHRKLGGLKETHKRISCRHGNPRGGGEYCWIFILLPVFSVDLVFKEELNLLLEISDF